MNLRRSHTGLAAAPAAAVLGVVVSLGAAPAVAAACTRDDHTDSHDKRADHEEWSADKRDQRLDADVRTASEADADETSGEHEGGSVAVHSRSDVRTDLAKEGRHRATSGADEDDVRTGHRTGGKHAAGGAVGGRAQLDGHAGTTVSGSSSGGSASGSRGDVDTRAAGGPEAHVGQHPMTVEEAEYGEGHVHVPTQAGADAHAGGHAHVEGHVVGQGVLTAGTHLVAGPVDLESLKAGEHGNSTVGLGVLTGHAGAETDYGSESETGAETGGATGTETGHDSETGAGIGTGNGAEAGSETGADTGTGNDAGVGVEHGVGVGADQGTQAGAGVGTGNRSEAGTETGAETGTEAGTEVAGGATMQAGVRARAGAEVATSTPNAGSVGTAATVEASTGSASTGILPQTGAEDSYMALLAAGGALVLAGSGALVYRRRFGESA